MQAPLCRETPRVIDRVHGRLIPGPCWYWLSWNPFLTPPGFDHPQRPERRQHQDKERSTAAKTKPCCRRSEGKALPEYHQNEIGFDDIQRRGLKARIWPVAQTIQTPMGNYAVGY